MKLQAVDPSVYFYFWQVVILLWVLVKEQLVFGMKVTVAVNLFLVKLVSEKEASRLRDIALTTNDWLSNRRNVFNCEQGFGNVNGFFENVIGEAICSITIAEGLCLCTNRSFIITSGVTSP